MNGWLLVASVVSGACIGFAVGSRLSGRGRNWLARAGFLAAAGVSATTFFLAGWRFGAPATIAVTTVALVGAYLLIASAQGLIEDNAPPTPAVREQILAHHAAAHLRYPPQPRGKRAFDIIAASAGILLTMPLWFVVATLIWFDEPGPVFFTKNSVGRGGITFREVKFRSMQYGAEQHTGPVIATSRDPRTLAIGRLIRRWHIDELPELINVLSGTMSVVGPRPLRAYVVLHELRTVPGFAERHTVRPGIACIAQIEKAHVEPAERLQKDLVYIRRMSLGFDLGLLVQAVVTTVLGEREPSPGHSATTVAPEAIAQPLLQPELGDTRPLDQ
jgi:lipopolysaccharide/colanic/teichoic acid biosynthesis glycosyltransferase